MGLIEQNKLGLKVDFLNLYMTAGSRQISHLNEFLFFYLGTFTLFESLVQFHLSDLLLQISSNPVTLYSCLEQVPFDLFKLLHFWIFAYLQNLRWLLYSELFKQSYQIRVTKALRCQHEFVFGNLQLYRILEHT